jgi:hypothetical protein
MGFVDQIDNLVVLLALFTIVIYIVLYTLQKISQGVTYARDKLRKPRKVG